MNNALVHTDNVWRLATIEEIFSGAIEEESIDKILCPHCHAPMELVHCSPSRLNHFRGKHLRDCPVVVDGRNHKAYKVATDVIIDDPVTMLGYKDPALAPITPELPPTTPAEPRTKDKPDIDDVDAVLLPTVRCVHTLRGMMQYIRSNGIEANLGNGHTGRDYLLTAPDLYSHCAAGNLGVKIIVTRRVLKSDVPTDVPDGYICLCDAFAFDTPTVFYLIKIRSPLARKEFFEKLTGKNKKGRKYSERNIVVLGDWKCTYKKDGCYVYKADVNSHCIHFTDFNIKDYV